MQRCSIGPAILSQKGGFSKEICRSMIAMMDADRSGKLGYEEFKSLWLDVCNWRVCEFLLLKFWFSSGFIFFSACSRSTTRINLECWAPLSWGKLLALLATSSTAESWTFWCTDTGPRMAKFRLMISSPVRFGWSAWLVNLFLQTKLNEFVNDDY